jgi:hypothetical protein
MSNYEPRRQSSGKQHHFVVAGFLGAIGGMILAFITAGLLAAAGSPQQGGEAGMEEAFWGIVGAMKASLIGLPIGSILGLVIAWSRHRSHAKNNE